ncbi:hypothetical protein DPV79_16015 [Burkholderia reimsis]|uniref:Uncharacterized protein n=1 Tax=Burkholderia reimsis TaxID=2234132 RepID=A0A365QUR2_9BURK|nr:hypothetical protein DPV79_16015 [Burkholderia reimsis]
MDATKPADVKLLRVTAPHFVAGAVWVRRGDAWQCVHAAPILAWMINKPRERVAEYLRRKRYKWEWL